MATDEQVSHMALVARAMGDQVLMGLCGAVYSIGVYCDGERTPCCGMGSWQARAVVTEILHGRAVEFTSRKGHLSVPRTRNTRRRIPARESEKIRLLVEESIRLQREKEARPEYQDLAAARAASREADLAWVATLETHGVGSDAATAAERAAIAAAEKVSLLARSVRGGSWPAVISRGV